MRAKLELAIFNEPLGPFSIGAIFNMLGLRRGPVENSEPDVYRQIVHSSYPLKNRSQHCLENKRKGGFQLAYRLALICPGLLEHNKRAFNALLDLFEEDNSDEGRPVYTR